MRKKTPQRRRMIGRECRGRGPERASDGVLSVLAYKANNNMQQLLPEVVVFGASPFCQVIRSSYFVVGGCEANDDEGAR